METTDYEYEIKRTRSDHSDDRCLALGLVEEAGEVAGLIKKLYYHGGADKKGPITLNRILNECGDVLWYLTTLLNCYSFTLADCMEMNIEKLRLRHPNGFTHTTAQNHADESRGFSRRIKSGEIMLVGNICFHGIEKCATCRTRDRHFPHSQLMWNKNRKPLPRCKENQKWWKQK